MSASTSSATASRSSLGPLTTTYTAPSICSIYGVQPGNGDFWQAQGCSDGNVVDTSSCWPPALVSAPNPPYEGWGFYSPGLVCPSGYVTACAAAMNSDGSVTPLTQAPSFSFQFPLVPGETAAGCCPPNFSCYGGPVQTCLSIITTGSYLAGICQSPVASLTDYQYITIPGTNTVTYALTISTATLSSAALFAPLFQLNWQSTDLPTTTASSLSSSSTITTSTSSSTATVAPVFSQGLSVGATVAIAVVIPVVLIAIAGVLACWWFRGRRRNRASVVAPTEGIARAVELQPSDKQSRKFDRRSELEASSRPHELETAGSGSDHKGYQPLPQELEASRS